MNYNTHTQGCSGESIWWRSYSKAGMWVVIFHGASIAYDGFAVVDDFGNLVRVPS